MIPRISTKVYQPLLLTRRYLGSLGHFRTSETDPGLLNESHAGRFYTINPSDYKTLFGATEKGIGLPTKFKQNCTSFRETCFLVRQPFLDVKRCIEAYGLTLPVLRYVLYGEIGHGKSMTLSTLVHYAYSRGFILVHIPWTPVWTKFAKDIQPSVTKPGNYDHNVDSVVWLTLFKHQNSKIFSETQITTSKTYNWSERENTPESSNLLDIVDHGITRPIHATECLHALLGELKVASTSQKCKVFVAIDGVNALFHDHPMLKQPDRTVIPYQKLTAFEAFKQLFASDWTGGVVVVTVDKFAMLYQDRGDTNTPRALLGKDGFEHMDPFVPIFVDRYSSQEVQTTIDYFLDRKWLTHPEAGTEKARLELEYVSVRNPYVLREICRHR